MSVHNVNLFLCDNREATTASFIINVERELCPLSHFVIPANSSVTFMWDFQLRYLIFNVVKGLVT